MPAPISRSDHSRSRLRPEPDRQPRSRPGADRARAFPSVPPAPPFLAAMGAARVGVLDLQVESDGRVRSTAPIVRLPDGRVALGFAALGAGWGVREAASVQRLLLTPSAPLADTATYSLGTLLACLSSAAGIDEVRKAVEGRIVVIGTTVLGEDEHRGPARFLGAAGARRRAIAVHRERAWSSAGPATRCRGRCCRSRRSSRRQAIGRYCSPGLAAPRRRRLARFSVRAHGVPG